MKKIILLAIVFAMLSFDNATQVYICNSKGAKKYHLIETCRGLSACKHEIKKVSLSSAKEVGFELCGWED